MKDNMKCQHTLPEDVMYKEVVVIGNGPSGMVTSFMLAGNVPYLKSVPQDLPIDEMLRARLSNLPEGQSLYETDLMELAEGLEGRSQNPIPLLMDNLWRPCADLGFQEEPLIEWRYDAEKQIDHIVVGSGGVGGAWRTFPPTVRTLSPAGWLTLPPHGARGSARLSARAVHHYCRRYVHACKLQRYFRCNVVVTSVTLAPPSEEPCAATRCPLAATYCVTGYDKSSRRQFRYLCARVVLASGSDRANTLAHVAPHALHSLAALERAASALCTQPGRGLVLAVGSGVSAADAVGLARARGLHALHVHRAPADTLAALPRGYRDYSQVYKMMCDGPSGNHENYTSYPSHIIVDVTPLPTPTTTDEDIGLKRVKLLNVATNETTELLVNIITVFIGSKPDLFFLRTQFSLDCVKLNKECQKCLKEKNGDEKCFKNRWMYLKSVLEQSIQICKSRYLDSECICDDKCIPYDECRCDETYRNGIGFGIDPNKPVDSRNPIAIDKGTHEVLNAPKGMYALGPLTADNFMRFIPGGALALVADMHKEK